MEEQKSLRTIIWAACIVICTAVACWSTYYAVVDSAAIKAGLQQSVSHQNSGGYWVERQTK